MDFFCSSRPSSQRWGRASWHDETAQRASDAWSGRRCDGFAVIRWIARVFATPHCSEILADMQKIKRPYVICHMAPSIDGRIAGVGSLRSLSAAYERTADTFDADAWIIGRVSMEPYAGKTRVPRRKVRS